MRLFFGIPVEEQDRPALIGVIQMLKQPFGDDRVSWSHPRKFHTTLHFLGEVDGVVAETLARGFSSLLFPDPFTLVVHGVDAFPSQQDPSTLFAHVEIHPSLFAVYKRLGDFLVEQGFTTDPRPFHPHITLGRIKTHVQALESKFIPLETTMTACRVVLYESVLTPSGSVYREFQEVPLEQ